MSIISASTTLTTALQYTADTTGTLVFKTGATPTTALTLNSDQSATFAGTVNFATAGFTNLSYTGTLTGGTGIVNLGSGQFYKDASGNVGVGTASPATRLDVQAAACIGKFTSTTGTNAVYTQMVNTGGNFFLGIDDGVGSTSGVAYGRFVYSAGLYPITFWTNSAERMRITSSGNVGVGTSNPLTKFVISDGSNRNIEFGYTSGATANYFESIDRTGAGSALDFLYSAAAHRFYTGGTERMRIDSSGQVGIGVNNPSGPLEVQANIYAVSYRARGRASDNLSYINFVSNAGADYAYVGVPAANQLAFYTNGYTERMRITSDGNLFVGTTGLAVTVRLAVAYAGGGSQYGMALQPITDNTTSIYFNNASGTGIGSINQTTSVVSYTTFSDYRLKENIAPMTGALDTVAKLKPVTYKWKVNGSNGQGFIAHELQEVVPDAVVGEKDAVDKDGKPKYQGIDTSFLVATLTAAIQELKAEFDEYKASHP
jgi:hypothetical protein